MYRVECKYCSDVKIYEHRAHFCGSRCPTCGSVAAHCRSYEWVGLATLASLMAVEKISIDLSVDVNVRKILENQNENF